MVNNLHQIWGFYRRGPWAQWMFFQVSALSFSKNARILKTVTIKMLAKNSNSTDECEYGYVWGPLRHGKSMSEDVSFWVNLATG